MSNSNQKRKIPKTILRNVQIPLKSTENRRSVIRHPVFTDMPVDECPTNLLKLQSTELNGRHSQKYKTPDLNSVLGLAEAMEKLAVKSPPKYTSTSQLTPRSKAVLDTNITKKLNFPPNKSVFKNLIPINVNNSILLPKERVSVRKNYKSTCNTDPIPELADFLDPLLASEHTIPQPEVNFRFSRAISDDFQNAYEIYKQGHPS